MRSFLRSRMFFILRIMMMMCMMNGSRMISSEMVDMNETTISTRKDRTGEPSEEGETTAPRLDEMMREMLTRLERVERSIQIPAEITKTTCSAQLGDEEDISTADEMSSSLVAATFVAVSILSLAWVLTREIGIVFRKVRQGGGNWIDVISYRTDYRFSTDSSVKPLCLLFSTVFLIIVGGVVFWLVSPTRSLSEAFWESWQFIAGGDHYELETLGERVVGLVMTVAGMMVFGFMVSIIEDGLSDYMDALREGKSRVVEEGHTLILGWGDKAIPIIVEVVLANESEGGGTVVVLADHEKSELEEIIADKELDLRGTIIVCRSGSTSVSSNLRNCSAAKAKSIICLADDTKSADENDSDQIRTILALLEEKVEGNVVVEIGSTQNARLIHLLAPRAQCVACSELIGRLMIQSTRVRGMHHVLTDVLGFEGSEFYISNWPLLSSQKLTFEQAHLWFEDAILCGYKDRVTGQIVLNPPNDTQMTANMDVVVFAEDDDTYEAAEPSAKDQDRWTMQRKLTDEESFKSQYEKMCNVGGNAEQILLVGWRDRMFDMIADLDSQVVSGSTLTIMCTLPLAERTKRMSRSYYLRNGKMPPDGPDLSTLRTLLESKEVDAYEKLQAELLVAERAECLRFGLNNFARIEHIAKSTVIRSNLERVFRMERYDVVLILADASDADFKTAQQRDSQSVASLLLLRDIRRMINEGEQDSTKSVEQGRDTALLAEKERCSPVCTCPILAEILDSHTKRLLTNHDDEDCLTSNELISKAMAMISESKDVAVLLEELLTEVGNEFYIEPATRFCADGEVLSFRDLCARAVSRREILFGFKDASSDTPVLNPPKKSAPRKWSSRDRLILIHE